MVSCRTSAACILLANENPTSVMCLLYYDGYRDGNYDESCDESWNHAMNRVNHAMNHAMNHAVNHHAMNHVMNRMILQMIHSLFIQWHLRIQCQSTIKEYNCATYGLHDRYPRCIRMGKQHGTTCTSHFLLLRLAPPRWVESLLRLICRARRRVQ